MHRANTSPARYNHVVTDAAQKLLDQALLLPNVERAKLAFDLLASLDGDPGWDEAWLTELDRRVKAAAEHGETGGDWHSAKERILGRLGRLPAG
ncbi:MAG: hypothetical protein DRJ42_26060, partial [Deltaproteobacteria bacterium]